jgi:hypothetical protein
MAVEDAGGGRVGDGQFGKGGGGCGVHHGSYPEQSSIDADLLA